MSQQPPTVIVQNRGCGSGCATFCVIALVVGIVANAVTWAGDHWVELATAATVVIGLGVLVLALTTESVANRISMLIPSRRAAMRDAERERRWAEENERPCPRCWRGVLKTEETCPRCGYPVGRLA